MKKKMKSLEELLDLVEYHVKHKDMNSAWAVASVCASHHLCAEGFHLIQGFVPPVYLSTVEPTDPNSCFELGIHYEDNTSNSKLSQQYFARAAAGGNLLAPLYLDDELVSWDYVLKLAQQGSTDAMLMWVNHRDEDADKTYWLDRAIALGSRAARLFRNPCVSIPFGRWVPDIRTHRLVPYTIHQQCVMCLLIAKRAQIPKYVALIIVAFIVTR
jgi:hypothetical protein